VPREAAAADERPANGDWLPAPEPRAHLQLWTACPSGRPGACPRWRRPTKRIEPLGAGSGPPATDGNDHTTRFAYDSKGRLSLIRYPLATADQGYDTVRFTLYDDAGRLLRRIDGRDVVTDYDYDASTGDLLSIAYPAYPAQDVAFTYDDLGRRTAMTDATGAHAYTYDDGGTLLSHTVTYTGLAAKTVSYTYYPNGSRATLTTPAGTSEYAYDAAGRLVELEYGLGTAAWE